MIFFGTASLIFFTILVIKREGQTQVRSGTPRQATR